MRAALLLFLATASGGSGAPATAPPAAGRTFVAWVRLADLRQQGAGVIGLMEEERFDSLTFGERVPARWMAGSDFFRRTQSPEEQLATPEETAGPGETLRMALVYRGERVTLYRNARVLADYTAGAAQTFTRNAAVLLGLRYLGPAGAVGHFHGAIEEARLYDRPLEPEEIARLLPGVTGTPPPSAWWTFDDGTARDRAGRYPPGTLMGGARIEGGALVLNGKDAYVVVERLDPGRARVNRLPQRMFYQPRRRTTGGMWDTWLFWRDGVYHLFVLAGPFGRWHGVAMATSPDGVSWREGDLVVRRAEGVTWLGTGSTWRSPAFERDGRYLLNFSEWRGDRQTIFFAESRDLREWKRLGPEFEFVQDPRWYEPAGRWDCIYTIAREGGGLYGYWTANPIGFVGFGFGESDDGAHWRALPPPRIAWGDRPPMGNCEVGAVEKIGGLYRLMLGSWNYDGYNAGMWSFVAERPDGPFRPAARNYCLLATRGRADTYFARFFPTPDGVLVNHHSVARDGRVWFAPLKAAVVDTEGTLRLAWWPGNERLKRRRVPLRLPRGQTGDRAPLWLTGTLPADEGIVIEGLVGVPEDAAEEGMGLRIPSVEGGSMDVRVRARGVTEFGPSPAAAAAFVPEQRVDREMRVGPEARFRLLIKGPLMEFYLEDVLIGCFSLPSEASGRLALLPDAGGRVARDVRAWR